jgi:hypothetical protein
MWVNTVNVIGHVCYQSASFPEHNSKLLKKIAGCSYHLFYVGNYKGVVFIIISL